MVLSLVLFVLSIKLCMQIYTENKPPTNPITHLLLCFFPLTNFVRGIYTEWESAGGSVASSALAWDCIDEHWLIKKDLISWIKCVLAPSFQSNKDMCHYTQIYSVYACQGEGKVEFTAGIPVQAKYFGLFPQNFASCFHINVSLGETFNPKFV